MVAIQTSIKKMLDDDAKIGKKIRLERLAFERDAAWSDNIGLQNTSLIRHRYLYHVIKDKVKQHGEDMGGHSNHKLYRTWRNMINRCYNPDHEKFKYYGERGVSVCEEWFSFLVFFEWAEKRWKKGLQLDKDIIKKGNLVYCPDFCQFVTHSENNRHRR